MSIPSKERLNRLLIVQAQSINDTFKLLDAPAAASMGKTDWSEVMKMANEISNQATMCALLSSGSSLEQLEDFIGSYCNLLLGLVLLCHGSTVGAGPTLRASIRDFAKPVIDHSLSLLHEALSSYGLRKERPLMPTLAGKVSTSCTRLQGSPSTDSAAIVRALAQVGTSMKDVLRELCEEEEEGEGGEPVKWAIEVGAAAVKVVKEGMRFVGGGTVAAVEVMEGVLEKLQAVGVQVDELGASAIPPLEPEEMEENMAEILLLAAAVEDELKGGGSGGSADGLFRAVGDLVGLLRRLLQEAGVGKG
ncbi:uncharacterized protein LOC144705784 [Wolffia australiana]